MITRNKKLKTKPPYHTAVDYNRQMLDLLASIAASRRQPLWVRLNRCMTLQLFYNRRITRELDSTVV
jgi:hypothetical protein